MSDIREVAAPASDKAMDATRYHDRSRPNEHSTGSLPSPEDDHQFCSFESPMLPANGVLASSRDNLPDASCGFMSDVMKIDALYCGHMQGSVSLTLAGLRVAPTPWDK